MKFVGSKSLLIDALATVQKAVGFHSTLSILEGVLIEANDDVKLTGYDQETGIERTMPADVLESGHIVVTARILSDVVRKLPDDTVKIQTDANHTLTIESGTSVIQIRGLSAKDYPSIPIVEDAKLLRIPQTTLIDMIRQTAFSASTDDSRPVLNGINVIVDSGRLTLVAVDGFRLAVRHEEVKTEDVSTSFIVPAKAMSEAARVLPPIEGDVSIHYSHNHILFDAGDTRLVSRLISGDFLNHKGLIPTTSESSIAVKTDALLDACVRASLMIDVDNRRVPVTLKHDGGDALEVSSRTNVGTTDETVPATLTGHRFDMDFNPKYFIDLLKVIPDETIKIDFTGTLGPCVVRPLDGDRFAYMILPLRR